LDCYRQPVWLKVFYLVILFATASLAWINFDENRKLKPKLEDIGRKLDSCSVALERQVRQVQEAEQTVSFQNVLSLSLPIILTIAFTVSAFAGLVYAKRNQNLNKNGLLNLLFKNNDGKLIWFRVFVVVFILYSIGVLSVQWVTTRLEQAWPNYYYWMSVAERLFITVSLLFFAFMSFTASSTLDSHMKGVKRKQEEARQTQQEKQEKFDLIRARVAKLQRN
jgi:magnesium-transporting ATPase (P-type)